MTLILFLLLFWKVKQCYQFNKVYIIRNRVGEAITIKMRNSERGTESSVSMHLCINPSLCIIVFVKFAEISEFIASEVKTKRESETFEKKTTSPTLVYMAGIIVLVGHVSCGF